DSSLDQPTDGQLFRDYLASTCAPSFIKTVSAWSSPSMRPNNCTVVSPKILPTTVMPRLIEEAWSGIKAFVQGEPLDRSHPRTFRTFRAPCFANVALIVGRHHDSRRPC